LARRILAAGGCLVSEYPPETPPLRHHFPARNRIIAGVSRGTVVVSAPEKSGALITAQFALAEGRDLWIASSGASSGGAAKLVGEGAKIISSAGEIAEEWRIHIIKDEENECQRNKTRKFW
jgi:DNA processing protein